MKIKLMFFISVVSVLALSCQKMPSAEIPAESKPNIDKSFFLTTPYEVEIRKGYITEVTMGEERLAYTDIPMTIQVPKTASLSKSRAASDEIKVKFYSYAEVPEFVKGTGLSEKTHVLMFEDSRKSGDFDYNDFVVVVKHSLKVIGSKYSYDFTVKPIALGSTFKSLKFGYVDENDGKTVYFSEDIRADYFKGSGPTSMINTTRGVDFKAPIDDNLNDRIRLDANGTPFDMVIIESFNKTYEGKDLKGGYYKYVGRSDKPVIDINTLSSNVNYFLEVNGNYKIFIAEVAVHSGSKLPYGLAIPSSLKSYPYENQRISDVYPGFENWVNNTGADYYWYNNPNKNGFDVDNEALYRWYPIYSIQ